MVMISIPILTAKKSLEGEGGVSQRTEYYTTAKVPVVVLPTPAMRLRPAKPKPNYG
jgi:hypothetical protein